MKNLSNRAILALLATLGFASACKDAVVMYGTPTATFKIKTNVKDKATNAPIKGIEVTAKIDKNSSQYRPIITDASGNVVLENSFFPVDVDVKVIAHDIDGAANGQYKDDSTVVSIKANELQGGSGWSSGSVEKEVTITLSEDKK